MLSTNLISAEIMGKKCKKKNYSKQVDSKFSFICEVILIADPFLGKDLRRLCVCYSQSVPVVHACAGEGNSILGTSCYGLGN